MAKGIFGGALRGVDAFGKTMEDVKVKTNTGAFITLLSFAIIATFTMIEFFDYRRLTIDTSILVDRARDEKLTVRFNMTFSKVPCYLLSLDVMDISGEQQHDITHNVVKTRLNEFGSPVVTEGTSRLDSDLDKLAKYRAKPEYCGSCYGGMPPESGCCQTCDDVRRAYADRGWSFTDPDAVDQCVQEGWTSKIQEQSNEGCNIAGGVRVNKVVGNFHFSPGRSFQTHVHHVHALVPYLKDQNHHNFGHTIHHFAFEGDDEYSAHKANLGTWFKEKMGIEYNPLDGVYGMTHSPQEMFQYFLKVVSTRFIDIEGETVNTHQYSVTNFQRDLSHGRDERTKEGTHLTHGNSGMPGAFFNYEISPMLVVHTENRKSFAHFLTSTCAIVGGVLTIASLVDSVLFATTRALKKGGVTGNGFGSKIM